MTDKVEFDTATPSNSEFGLLWYSLEALAAKLPSVVCPACHKAITGYSYLPHNYDDLPQSPLSSLDPPPQPYELLPCRCNISSEWVDALKLEIVARRQGRKGKPVDLTAVEISRKHWQDSLSKLMSMELTANDDGKTLVAKWKTICAEQIQKLCPGPHSMKQHADKTVYMTIYPAEKMNDSTGSEIPAYGGQEPLGTTQGEPYASLAEAIFSKTMPVKFKSLYTQHPPTQKFKYETDASLLMSLYGMGIVSSQTMSNSLIHSLGIPKEIFEAAEKMDSAGKPKGMLANAHSVDYQPPTIPIPAELKTRLSKLSAVALSKVLDITDSAKDWCFKAIYELFNHQSRYFDTTRTFNTLVLDLYRLKDKKEPTDPNRLLSFVEYVMVQCQIDTTPDDSSSSGTGGSETPVGPTYTPKKRTIRKIQD